MSERITSTLELGQKVGEGHFGEVFIAQDEVHGQVAVKVFKRMPNETTDEWDKRKSELLIEGQRLKDASHRNIVSVYHFGEAASGETVYLVLEYCNHGCLQKLGKNQPFEIGYLRKYLLDAAQGLSEIHSHEMLHRDIKPSNLLLHKNTVKIGDFGLVTDNLLWGYASLAGYTEHLAKEVLEYQPTSFKSDIWAFGMTTYRLLVGEKFYQSSKVSKNSTKVADTIMQGGYAKKLKWLPHIPQEWKRFVKKAMHDDTKLRIQTAYELQNELNKLPDRPNWACNVAENEIQWQLERNNRTINVVHKIHSPRRHEWIAKSKPLAGRAGRVTTLGASNGVISKSQVQNELTDFFKRYQ